MVRLQAWNAVPGTLRVVIAALIGAVAGFAMTTAALGSLEFGFFGAIGSAVATTIAAAIQVERSAT